MPRNATNARIEARYYVWLLGRQNGVYYADGRSNSPSLGRHSLGTRDERDALDALQRLDLVQAVKCGRADPSALAPQPTEALSLERGRALYEKYVGRSKVTGGARPSTSKRYRAVFDKYVRFANQRGIICWESVTVAVLQSYASWLDDQSYAYATAYLELTTLKQAIKWFVDAGHLPNSCLFRLPLTKTDGTNLPRPERKCTRAGPRPPYVGS
jgi:hypothetical protein